MSSVPLNPHEVSAMPGKLRTLLEAELAAGNEVSEVGHCFPAPPSGAYFRLAKPLQSLRAPGSHDLDYHDRNLPSHSGEITDAGRRYFLLEPPHEAGPAPDMDAIRAAARGATSPVNAAAPAGSDALERFKRSMTMDYEKWHDGDGYDLDALRAMTPAEQESAAAMLISRGISDWRDVEALACCATPAADAALREAIDHPNVRVRNAVTRHASERLPEPTRVASLVEALQTTFFFGGMSQALDQVADFHPAPIVETLLQGLLKQSGDIAVHFAAMLCFIHGQAAEPFDLAQRRFFLRFNTERRGERESAFRELCERIGIDPNCYLPASGGPT